MITVNNLVKAYNQRVVLDIDHLQINEGELFGLVGNNGAGKTTLFRLMLDLIRASEGSIQSGECIVSVSEAWKDYTASYLDESFLIGFLTPYEYFHFIGETYGFSKADIENKLKDYKSFLTEEIIDEKKKFIRDFSKGNKQKIGIVSSIIIEPKVLVLDEPFDGLDPTSQILLKRILVKLNEQTKATILVSSHDLNHVTEICKRIVLLEKGKVIRDISDNPNALTELEQYFAPDRITE
ncbi:MAG TPA: ABC transporter ATP-binding protein [Bacteroidales bacterium]|nr:ABC transporter ATP-binding protein [Bacteroidales bacterium]